MAVPARGTRSRKRAPQAKPGHAPRGGSQLLPFASTAGPSPQLLRNLTGSGAALGGRVRKPTGLCCSLAGDASAPLLVLNPLKRRDLSGSAGVHPGELVLFVDKDPPTPDVLSAAAFTLHCLCYIRASGCS